MVLGFMAHDVSGRDASACVCEHMFQVLTNGGGNETRGPGGRGGTMVRAKEQDTDNSKKRVEQHASSTVTCARCDCCV
jgi:hypothetical protein